MNFIRNLFGGKESTPPTTSKNNLPREDVIISDTQAAPVVKKLIFQAMQEKWNPTFSIKLICTNCEAPVTLRKTSATEFAFVSAKGSFRPGGLEDSIKCEKCEGTNFRVAVHPKTLKECLKEALSKLSPTDQNPGVGFREDITGRLIVDTSLKHTSNFDELWQAISRYVDPFDGFNRDYSFNMIRTHYLDRDVPGLALFNESTNVLTTIIKDEKGNYWFSVEG